MNKIYILGSLIILIIILILLIFIIPITIKSLTRLFAGELSQQYRIFINL